MSIIYECVRCGEKDSIEKWERGGGRFKCPLCGFKVGKKIRSPIVRRVKAE